MRKSKLCIFREKCRFNQREMAREIGVSTSYYSKIEGNFQNPSFDFLCKLKKRFPKISIDEIFFK